MPERLVVGVSEISEIPNAYQQGRSDDIDNLSISRIRNHNEQENIGLAHLLFNDQLRSYRLPYTDWFSMMLLSTQIQYDDNMKLEIYISIGDLDNRSHAKCATSA